MACRKRLRPLFLAGTTEYPSIHVLRLNEEYASRRDENVVDLRGTIVTGREQHIVK